MSTRTFDVVVVGGGPGGYATALRARARNLSVALVEADRVGGTCLHRGCVPSKALLHAAAVNDQVRRLAGTGGNAVSAEAAGRLRDTTVAQLHRGLQGLLDQRGVVRVPAWGRLVGPGRKGPVAGPGGSVELDTGEALSAGHVVLAPGSRPRSLPAVPVDGTVVMTSDEALELDRVPERAVVVGGGAIGVEFACIWAGHGTAVTIVEATDRLLPAEDAASSAFLARALRRRGITVKTAVTVDRCVSGEGQARLHLSDGTVVDGDLVLVAAGRVPATAGCGAAELGLLDERGFVAVDDRLQTRLAGVWAVGDAVPTLALAHVAFAEGFAVADRIAGLTPPSLDYTAIPRVTYSHPEVASVGVTEDQARARFGDRITVTVTSLAGNARALIDGDDGQVKTVLDPAGEVVGVHLVGPQATELIGEAGLAVSWGARADEIASVVHAHPTVSESLAETMLAAIGLPFHAHA